MDYSGKSGFDGGSVTFVAEAVHAISVGWDLQRYKCKAVLRSVQ